MEKFKLVLKQVWRVLGPIVLSAFSLFVTSTEIIQPFAFYLDPSFNLLSNRGVGKSAFIFMVILQVILVLICSPKKLFNKFFDTSFKFFWQKKWVVPFLKYFVSFFILHSLMQILFCILGFSTFTTNWGHFNFSFILKMLLGLFAAFMVAWTEETIFRGMLYNYFKQFTTPLISIFATSTIFMLAHDLSNPLNLVTKEWRLGLGLFLLGFLLNLIYELTGKLYKAMGAHAGLVSVKVVLRRMKFFIFTPAATWPIWFHSDLRKCFITHALFAITILILVIKNYKQLTTSSNID